MTVKELNVDDTFRVAGEPHVWRKVSLNAAMQIDADGKVLRSAASATVASFKGKEIEVVERTADIRRAGDVLVLRGGEVELTFLKPWRIHRCTPGDPLTEFALFAQTFTESRAAAPTAETALPFSLTVGCQHLNRPPQSEILAYNGRLYARATKKEVLGKAAKGGYKLIRNIDGAKRVIIMGLLVLPGEFALHDLIMEHFGPDTVPR